jgi:very-short-patch-repair endonuclease
MDPIGLVDRPFRVKDRARDDRLRALIRAQDGALGVRQARDAGMSRAEIAARVASGEWIRDLSGVLRATDRPITPRFRIRAAMLSLGEGATLVGRSAAFWWHLTDVPPAEIEIAMAHGTRVRPRPGVRLVRRAVGPEGRVVVDGVAVTRKPATVLAAAAALGLLLGAQFMDHALQSGVDLAALRREHLRSAGRHGAGVASQLLILAGGGARSEAERIVHRLLRAARIEGWHANHEVWLRGYGQAFLDLAFTECRVLVEIDGWAYHRGLRSFLRDARRQNALVLEGWVVIRTNWFELQEAPEVFVANLREALASRGRAAKI